MSVVTGSIGGFQILNVLNLLTPFFLLLQILHLLKVKVHIFRVPPASMAKLYGAASAMAEECVVHYVHFEAEQGREVSLFLLNAYINKMYKKGLDEVTVRDAAMKAGEKGRILVKYEHRWRGFSLHPNYAT